MTKICSIKGVPLSTRTTPCDNKLSGLNFAIVAKHIINPNGKEISRVRKNKKIELAKPLSNSNVIDKNSPILF